MVCHWPTKPLKGSSAGFGRNASLPIFFFHVLNSSYDGPKTQDSFWAQTSYLPLSMAVTPDVKRFSQAMKHQVPSFRSYSHPSVQNRSTLQLIYQLVHFCHERFERLRQGCQW